MILFNIHCLCNHGDQGDWGFRGIVRMRCVNSELIRHRRIPSWSPSSNYCFLLRGSRVQQRHRVSAVLAVWSSLAPSIYPPVRAATRHSSFSLTVRETPFSPSCSHPSACQPQPPPVCSYITLITSPAVCGAHVWSECKVKSWTPKPWHACTLRTDNHRLVRRIPTFSRFLNPLGIKIITIIMK